MRPDTGWRQDSWADGPSRPRSAFWLNGEIGSSFSDIGLDPAIGTESSGGSGC
jgi:hypothetical protein